jgi:hypothetical protein
MPLIGSFYYYFIHYLDSIRPVIYNFNFIIRKGYSNKWHFPWSFLSPRPPMQCVIFNHGYTIIGQKLSFSSTMSAYFANSNVKNEIQVKHIFRYCIVMIDSITNSVCLCYYVQNGLSYSGEETRPTLCIKRRQAKIWRHRS